MNKILKALDAFWAPRTIEQIREMPPRTLAARLCFSLVVLPLALIAMMASGCGSVVAIDEPDAEVPMTSDGGPDAGVPVIPDATPAAPDAMPVMPDADPGAPTLTYVLAPDDIQSEAGIVVGGGINAILAKIRFTATGDDLTLTKVRVSIPADSVPGVLNLRLYDGSTLIGVPVVPDAAGDADFVSGLAFTVPADGSKTLTVKAELASVGPAGASSGLDLTVTLKDGLGEAGTYEVRDPDGNVIDTVGDGGDISGRTKVLRKTKPTISLVALPTTTLSNGTQVLLRFTVTADAAENVSFKKATFNATLANAGGANLTLTASAIDSNIREVGQAFSIAGSASPMGCTTSGTATCTIPVTFASEQTVTAGTSRTYELRLTVSGADASGEAVSTWMVGGDADIVTGPLYEAYNFVWSDNSAVPHSDLPGASSADWTNGVYIKVLPSDPQTITRF